MKDWGSQIRARTRMNETCLGRTGCAGVWARHRKVTPVHTVACPMPRQLRTLTMDAHIPGGARRVSAAQDVFNGAPMCSPTAQTLSHMTHCPTLRAHGHYPDVSPRVGRARTVHDEKPGARMTQGRAVSDSPPHPQGSTYRSALLCACSVSVMAAPRGMGGMSAGQLPGRWARRD